MNLELGETLLRKLSKVEIALCGLLGLVLFAGIGAALAELLALSLISILFAIGLSAVLVVKNGGRLGYISSKTKYAGSNLKDIEDSLEALHERNQKTSSESLSFLKRSAVQSTHFATDLGRQSRANREQMRIIESSVLAAVQSNHQILLEESNKHTTELKNLRDELRRVSGRQDALCSRNNELLELSTQSANLTQATIASRIESEINRCVAATSERIDDLQISLVTRGRGLVSKLDELGVSVEGLRSSAVDVSEEQAVKLGDQFSSVAEALSSKLDELGVSVEVVRSSAVDVSDAQTSELEAKLISTTEELSSISSLLKDLYSSDQVLALSNSVSAMKASIKVEIATLLAGMQDVSLTESTVEKLTAVTAHEGLQTRRQLRRHITDTVRDSTRQVEAIAKLMPRLREVNPLIPSTGGFALDAQALLHLIDVLERVRPSTIVEFGGGTSTIWIAYICKQYNTRIISIDHLEEYLEQTRREVARHGFTDMVECRLAPLETLEVNGAEYSWYSVSALSDISGVDLLFIDGPPESTGANARRPAMHVMLEKLRPNAVVILDDTHRESEQETVREWVSTYPEFKVVDDHISRLSILESIK